MLEVKVDYRLGGVPHPYVVDENEPEHIMQVHEDILKCIAFACYNNGGGKQNEGTAFFVHYSHTYTEIPFVYAITAKHVVANIARLGVDETLYLRVNTKDGGHQYIPTNVKDWRDHPDPAVDVSVLSLKLPKEIFDYKFILAPITPLGMAARIQELQKIEINVGDEIFYPGLFVNNYGKHQNAPILRIGNIARMPYEPIMINGFPCKAFLIESRSIGGLSGSPVFVHLNDDRLADLKKIGVILPGDKAFLYISFWIGIISGHFGDDLNTGISAVVPVDNIIEALNQKEFVLEREKAINAANEKGAITLDSASSSLTEESFEDALKQVSRPIDTSEPGQEES